jgi:predicted outer membrane repeat protein
MLCNLGAVSLSDANVTFVESFFISNIASQNGGAMSILGDSSLVDISSVIFRNNSAGLNGGAVEIIYSDVAFEHSSFEGNSVQQSGGTIEYHSIFV